MRLSKELSGSLHDVAVIDLLQILSMTARTGTLRVNRPGRSANLVLEQGRVMTVELSPAQRYLASYFLDRGWIDFSTLHRALVLQAEDEHHRLIGQILVDVEALTVEQLVEGLRNHVREAISEVLRWSEGEFWFAEQTQDSPLYGELGIYLEAEELDRLAEAAQGPSGGSSSALDEGSWPARARLAIVVTGDVLVSHGLYQNLFSEAFSVVHAPALREVTKLLLASEDQSPSLVLDLDVFASDAEESVRAFGTLRELYREWPNLNLVTFGRGVPDAFYAFAKECALSFHMPRPTRGAEMHIQVLLDFVDALAKAVMRARRERL